MITLSSGTNWEQDPGPTVILRNSTFESNKADLGNAGVVYLGEFSAIFVEGDRNVFEGNSCKVDGGVFGGTTNTSITVEGGVFRNNKASKVSGPGSLSSKHVVFCVGTYLLLPRYNLSAHMGLLCDAHCRLRFHWCR